MTKQEWLQICRLYQEWYYRGVVFENKVLNEENKRWIEEHMPSDDIFNDGRIEFFQENFKPEIDEDKLNELALEYVNKQLSTDYKSLSEITDDLDQCAIEDFKAGYRKAKVEIL